ncbi:PhzF family phenazine biosynthesis protein [Glycomyces sp. NPDC047010]|uniref:PhzF family phenazine biosynthesis protein n=1 Tax=Glycomyces sp. NPDC047010 TaxID=3155023 RepID=UPI0034090B40
MKVLVVDACWRGAPGTGSPTAVVEDDGCAGADRTRVPVAAGTSHAVFLDRTDPAVVGLRFFTAAGELPACGHGTLAALAVLEGLDGRDEWRLRAGGQVFAGGIGTDGPWFDAGTTRHRTVDAGPALAALGAEAAGPVVAAGAARERLLVPVRAEALAGLAPDFAALKAACDAADLLGCFVYAEVRERWFAARMFAPSIGVDEDAANANSAAALAGALVGDVPLRLVVSMGEPLGLPSRIRAEAFPGGGVRLSGRVGPVRVV